MNVKVPARAPTTPPDMGASMKAPALEVAVWEATVREVRGSMVEQSMKRRDCDEEDGGEGRGLLRMWL